MARSYVYTVVMSLQRSAADGDKVQVALHFRRRRMLVTPLLMMLLITKLPAPTDGKCYQ